MKPTRLANCQPDWVKAIKLFPCVPLQPIDQPEGIILDLWVILNLDHDTLAALEVDNLDCLAKATKIQRAVEVGVYRARDRVLDIALASQAAAVVEIDLERVDQFRGHHDAAVLPANQLPGVKAPVESVSSSFVHGCAFDPVIRLVRGVFTELAKQGDATRAVHPAFG